MPNVVPTRENTCAIIVTYHPDNDFPQRAKIAVDQFDLTILVDNGSIGEELRMLQEMALNSDIELVENGINVGIAAALNRGCRAAFASRYEWVVLLDQDTLISPVMLSVLADVFLGVENQKTMLGSNYHDAHKGRDFISCTGNDAVYRERKTLITSGTLMSLEMFREIGEFREDYFIDSVDHEYCLRARRHGYRVIISCQPLMTQRIGAGAENGRRQHRFMSFNHSAQRKYFIARNTVATAKLYLFQEPAWSVRQGWRLAMDLTSIILYEKNKARKLRAFLMGLFHGIFGKMGPIEKTWPRGKN